MKSIVVDAGGRIVGRTKLQKIAYLLEEAGEGDGFYFDYHHYGPYSEELSNAISIAVMNGDIDEEERVANWGGHYSIYTTSSSSTQSNDVRQRLVHKAAEANAVVLELAATAVYFASRGEDDPWHETEVRKPDKAAEERLEEAKRLYEALRCISDKLPAIETKTG
ncbi:MAG: hypothetical protein FWC28_06225 [Proteobacteria bacterium]|nr:hypothetical protein [Pseudomonadota bacterium]